MRAIVTLLALGALICALAVLGAGPGARMELWDWRTGLTMMRQASSPFPIIEGKIALSPLFTLAALSALGGVAAIVARKWRFGMFAIVCAAIAGASGLIPLKMRELAMGNPFIHDITTDFANPPPIIAGAAAERINPPQYVGGEMVRDTGVTVADAQREAFPDIAPQILNANLDESVEIVREVLGDMNMPVLKETFGDDGWLIEATYTSTWFGFVDDFVVRLTPQGSRTRVDVRSKSRVGGSDLGANAARVRAFFKRLGEEEDLTPLAG